MGAYLSTPVTEKESFEGQGSGLRYAGCAMQGWRRTMEDAHLAQLALGNDSSVAMFGVFDGHGGAEVAKFCQKYMSQEFQNMDGYGPHNIEDCLVRVFHKMDDMLRDARFSEELETLKTKEAADDDDAGDEGQDGVASTMDALDLLKKVFQLKRFMGDAAGQGGSESKGEGEAAQTSEENLVQAGCTAVVALKYGNELYVANAGDSRGVLCRGGKAVPLSEDHKPAHEIERSRIIAAGGFLSEIGGVCRVNGNLNLSRAIGDLKYKSNSELPAKDQIITAQPDIKKVTLTPEDSFFLLACDGVWDVMSNQDAVDFVESRLAQGMTPTQISAALLDACLANDPKEARGVGCDNMTVVIVQLLQQPQ